MIKTAQEFLLQTLDLADDGTFIGVTSKDLVEFTKLHVEAALKAASEKATMNLEYPEDYAESNETGLTFANAEEISRGGEYGSVTIDENSILNAYPLENIK